MASVWIARKVVDRFGRYFGSMAAVLLWVVGAILVITGVIADHIWIDVVCVVVGLAATAVAMLVAVELRVDSEIERESRWWRRRSASQYLPESAGSPGSGFLPLAIPATKGPRRLSAQVGRAGAQVSDDQHSAANFRYLLEEAGEGLPMMDLIGTAAEAKEIQDVAEVRLVNPGLHSIRLRKESAYFVISSSAFHGGAWQGALGSENRSIGGQILTAIQVARKYGKVSVFLDYGDPPTHLSGQLEKSVDVVVTGAGSSTDGRSVRTRVLDELERLMSTTPQ